MSESNPYQTPRADLGADQSATDFAPVLADFTGSRAPLLAVAVLLLAMTLIGVGSTVYTLARVGGDLGGAYAITLVFLGVSIGGNLLGAGAVLWLRQAVTGLGPTTSVRQVTTVLQRLGSFWLLAAFLWCVPVLANLAMSVGMWFVPLLGAAIAGQARDGELMTAARRWRDMVRVCVVAGGAVVLLKVAGQVVSSMGASGMVAIEARVWLFGGVLAQVAFGAMAWTQVPALEAFVAEPSPAKLAAVAAAHRLFWRVAAWGALAVLVFNLLSGLLMSFMF